MDREQGKAGWDWEGRKGGVLREDGGRQPRGPVGNRLPMQFPRRDDALLLPEPLVLRLLHRVPLHRAVLHHEPGEWPCPPVPGVDCLAHAVLGTMGMEK